MHYLTSSNDYDSSVGFDAVKRREAEATLTPAPSTNMQEAGVGMDDVCCCFAIANKL